jgi:glutamyl-tRNA reductase
MKIHPNETFESWSDRVSMYERGYALQRIANGDDTEKVMEDMSRRITQKLLHPIFKAINDSSKNIDIAEFEKSKQEYYDKMSKVGPVADHIDTNT